jgi:hypothetical protein
MSTHKTFFGKLLAGDFNGAFGDLKAWLKGIWKDADHNVLKTAIQVTTAVKDALESKLVTSIIAFTTTKIDDDVSAFLHKNIVVLLADELLIQGITPDSTEEEVQAVAQKIVDSFGGMADKDKQQLFTSVAANAYRLWQDVKQGKHITFGAAAALVEGAYKVDNA